MLPITAKEKAPGKKRPSKLPASLQAKYGVRDNSPEEELSPVSLVAASKFPPAFAKNDKVPRSPPFKNSAHTTTSNGKGFAFGHFSGKSTGTSHSWGDRVNEQLNEQNIHNASVPEIKTKESTTFKFGDKLIAPAKPLPVATTATIEPTPKPKPTKLDGPPFIFGSPLDDSTTGKGATHQPLFGSTPPNVSEAQNTAEDSTWEVPKSPVKAQSLAKLGGSNTFGAPVGTTNYFSILQPIENDDKPSEHRQRVQEPTAAPPTISTATEQVQAPTPLCLPPYGKTTDDAVAEIMQDIALLPTPDAERKCTILAKLSTVAQEIRREQDKQRERAEVMLKQEIAEIKAMLANRPSQPNHGTAPPSWAHVAAGTPAQITEIGKRERLEKARRDQQKKEIVISWKSADDAECQRLDEASETTYTEAIQHAIKAHPDTKAIELHRVKKLPGRKLKLQLKNQEDAKALRDREIWKAVGSASTHVAEEYGVVLHGVPKAMIDATEMEQDEMRDKIEDLNDIKVSRVTPLTRKPRNPTAPTQSIVVYTKTPEDANTAINEYIRIQGRIFQTRRYSPQDQIRQCFRCHGYGHKAEVCKKEHRCGNCAEPHDTRMCERETVKCINCNGSHPAWHPECARRIRERERLDKQMMTTPPLYQC
jgi:hypothetical protein